MKVALHIERIVLDGLPVTAAQLPALRAELERELTALLTAQPPRADALSAVAGQAGNATLAAGSGCGLQLERLGAPRLQWRPAAGVAALGSGIAHSVHASLGGPR
ncbi:MAG: hypothetical protein KGI67_09040 [Pseudomonadota bacterium]|nr:hypothetical protein [Pseudomonadota bacterium]